jgi:hypothetical protein
MRRVSRSIAFFIALLAYSAATAQSTSPTDLLALLRAQWTVPETNDIRSRAISTAFAQLNALDKATIAVRLATGPLAAFGAGEIKSILQKELPRLGSDRTISIRDVALTFGRQHVGLAVNVEYADPNLTIRADLVGDIAPAIQGNDLLFGARVVSVEIRSAETRGTDIDVPMAVSSANSTLRQLIDAANNALVRENSIKSIPLSLGWWKESISARN